MKHVDLIKINERFVGDSKYIANEMIYIEEENINLIDLKSADICAFGLCLMDLLTGKLIRGRHTYKRSRVA